MTFLHNNTPGSSRVTNGEASNNRANSPASAVVAASAAVHSPVNGTNRPTVLNAPVVTSPVANIHDQINVGALSIDHTMTEPTQVTSPQNYSLTTRGRAPVRDAALETTPAPVRCINPASGMFMMWEMKTWL